MGAMSQNPLLRTAAFLPTTVMLAAVTTFPTEVWKGKQKIGNQGYGPYKAVLKDRGT